MNASGRECIAISSDSDITECRSKHNTYLLNKSCDVDRFEKLVFALIDANVDPNHHQIDLYTLFISLHISQWIEIESYE